MSNKAAREKLMDYLARRDHSEKELRQKLARKFESEAIDAAIADARNRGWIAPPEDIAAKAAKVLHRKEKGHRYIRNFLRTRGLPDVERDAELELEKALNVVERKFRTCGPFPYNESGKVVRYLANRGFDDETIRRVVFSGSKTT